MTDGGTPAAEPPGHIGGGLALALVIPQIEESDPDGLDLLVDGVPPVAALVPPLLVFGVRGGSVYFDARPVLLVEVVEVFAAVLLADSDLPFGGWQAVRAFYAPDVTQFKQGHDPFAGVAEREFDVAPPPHPRAGAHRLTYPLRRRAAPTDGTADPVVCLIEAARAFDEIEHRVLNASAGRSKDRMSAPRYRA